MTAAAADRGASAPRSLPVPSEGTLAEALRELLPERSEEDRALGIISVPTGHKKNAAPLRVPVLFAGPNRAWKDQFAAAARKVLADLEQDATGETVISLVMGLTEQQLDLLEAYNPELLKREWLETHATEEQVLDAFLGVTAAAFPFPAKIARAVLGNREISALLRELYLGSTSSSPPSTDGAPAPSKPN